MDKLDVNQEKIKQDLNNNYVVITEGIQTILRKYGCTDAYEKLKKFSRNNKKIMKEDIDNFINSLDVNSSIKRELLNIDVNNYISTIRGHI